MLLGGAARGYAVLLLGVVLFAAGFLPWMDVLLVKGYEGLFVRVPFSAWETDLDLLGVLVPNWVVPVIGLACAILAFATLKSRVHVPWQLPFGLATYVLAHSAALAAHAGRRCGAGLVVSVACGLGMALLGWRASPAPRPPRFPAPDAAGPSTSGRPPA